MLLCPVTAPLCYFFSCLQDIILTEKEVDYAISKGKIIKTIRLDEFKNKDDLMRETKKIMQKMRVFISSSSKDRKITKQFKEQFMDKDFKVFCSSDDIGVGVDWREEMEDNIRLATEYGCIILLLTENSIKSPWALREIQCAVDMMYQSGRRCIFPIIMDEVEQNAEVNKCLCEVPYMFINKNPKKAEIRFLCEEIISKINEEMI